MNAKDKRIQELEAVLKRVPIARIREDFTGLECIGCGAGPDIRCEEDCWALAVDAVLHESPLPVTQATHLEGPEVKHAPLPTLTTKQLEELKRLNDGPQYTFGKGRARVQNTLVKLGLAYFIDMGGRCLINGAGAYLLTHYIVRAPTRAKTKEVKEHQRRR